VVDWGAGDIVGAGSGAAATGTNNIAELQGAIDGLKFVVKSGLHVGNVVELVSDSEYCLGLANGTFEANKNLELAADIRALVIKTSARTRWVRGHSGEVFNEKADELAKAARNKLLPDQGIRRRHRRRSLRHYKRAIVKAYKRGELYREPLRG
jgi:ribonuclease HI